MDECFPSAAFHFTSLLEHHCLVLRRGVAEIDSGLVKWSLDPFGSTKNEVIVASVEFAYDTVRRVLWRRPVSLPAAPPPPPAGV